MADNGHRFRNQKCGCQRCSYCARWLATRHEHDHFPIPAFYTHGEVPTGQDVQAACLDCHDLKDRIPLEDWPKELLAESNAQLEENLGYRAVFLLGGLHSWMQGGWADEEANPDWLLRQAETYRTATDQLPYPSRLLVAKYVSLAFHTAEGRRVKAGRLF